MLNLQLKIRIREHTKNIHNSSFENGTVGKIVKLFSMHEISLYDLLFALTKLITFFLCISKQCLTGCIFKLRKYLNTFHDALMMHTTWYTNMMTPMAHLSSNSKTFFFYDSNNSLTLFCTCLSHSLSNYIHKSSLQF